MSWAEFQIRSIGLKRVYERDERLFREVTYQVFCLQYMFGKKQPPKKEKFWPIGEGAKINPKQKAAYMKAVREFIKKQDAGT